MYNKKEIDKLGHYVIYLRKSRADIEAESHGEGETLARHRSALLSLAKKLGISITAIYEEIVSGERIANRPEMMKLLDEVDDGLWDGVLVMEVERLARGDTKDQGIVAESFKYSNTLIITPQRIYDPNDESDEEYFEFGLFMSRREYKTIKRRLQNGRLASVSEGHYAGSKPPYGYERVKIQGDRSYTLSPIPDQEEIVKYIYESYVYGERQEDGTRKRIGTSIIARRINEMGVPSGTGKKWVCSSVDSILRNPVYIGLIRWDGRKHVKSIVDGKVVTSRPRNHDYKTFKGLHPAIIEDEIYYKAQELMKQSKISNVKYTKLMKNPLAGLVYCAECGRAMQRKPVKDGQETYIMCQPSCPTVSTRIRLVESQTIEFLKEYVRRSKIDFEDTSVDESDNSIKLQESLLSAAISRMETYKKQADNLYDLLEQNVYTTEVFLSRSKILEEKMKLEAETITKLEDTMNNEKSKASRKNDFVPRVQHLIDVYDTSSAEEKNTLLKGVIERIEYKKLVRNKKGDGSTPRFELQIYPRIEGYE